MNGTPLRTGSSRLAATVLPSVTLGDWDDLSLEDHSSAHTSLSVLLLRFSQKRMRGEEGLQEKWLVFIDVGRAAG